MLYHEEFVLADVVDIFLQDPRPTFPYPSIQLLLLVTKLLLLLPSRAYTGRIRCSLAICMYSLVSHVLCIIIMLSPLYIATLTPSGSVVTTLHGGAVFTCFSQRTEIGRIQWLLNGTSIEDQQVQNVEIVISFSRGIGRLDLNNLPSEYNNSRIECTITFMGMETLRPGATTITLQGKPR